MIQIFKTQQQISRTIHFFNYPWCDLNYVSHGCWINSDHLGAKVWQAKMKTRHEYYNQEDAFLGGKEKRRREWGTRWDAKDASEFRGLAAFESDDLKLVARGEPVLIPVIQESKGARVRSSCTCSNELPIPTTGYFSSDRLNLFLFLIFSSAESVVASRHGLWLPLKIDTD